MFAELSEAFWMAFFGGLPATIAAVSTAIIAIVSEMRRQRADIIAKQAVSEAKQAASDSRDTGVANLALTAGIAANTNFVPASAKCIPRVCDEVPGDNEKAKDMAQTAIKAAHSAVEETRKANA